MKIRHLIEKNMDLSKLTLTEVKELQEQLEKREEGIKLAKEIIEKIETDLSNLVEKEYVLAGFAQALVEYLEPKLSNYIKKPQRKQRKPKVEKIENIEGLVQFNKNFGAVVVGDEYKAFITCDRKRGGDVTTKEIQKFLDAEGFASTVGLNFSQLSGKYLVTVFHPSLKLIGLFANVDLGQSLDSEENLANLAKEPLNLNSQLEIQEVVMEAGTGELTEDEIAVLNF